MKFEVNGKEFKNAIDRAMVIMAKNPSIHTLDYIRIVSGDDNIVISSTNIENFVDVVVDANIIEPGEMYVDKSNIVKAYGLEDCVMISFDGKILTSKNKRKCCEVPAEILDKKDYPKTPILDENIPCILKNSKEEMIEAFSSMDCMRGHEDGKPIISGYNFNGKNKWIAVCDSFRLAVKKLSGEFLKTDFNITLSGEGCNNLKKIGKSKNDSILEIYMGTPSGCKVPLVFFKGDDFTYCTRLLEGVYIDISKLLISDKDYSFEVDTSELEKIAKEYVKEKEAPMYIIKSNGKMFTAIKSLSYQTADVLGTVEDCTTVDNEYCFCMSPKFLKESISLFKNDDKITVYGEAKKKFSPIFFKGEKYTSLVLPVRHGDGIYDVIKAFVEKI